MARTFKYRDGRGGVNTIKAVSVYGLYTGGTSYEVFRKVDGTEVRVAERMLLPGMKAKASLLYGKRWLDKVEQAAAIKLTPRDESELGGLPADTECVWTVNYDTDIWVIQCANRCILHIINNPERTVRGTAFHTILRKMFPTQKIAISFSVCKTKTVTVR